MRGFRQLSASLHALGGSPVRLAGLIEPRGDRLVLTSDAASYLASADQEDLYRTMCENVAGLEETLDRIRQSPVTLAELTTFLNARLGTQWDTDAQAKWRVQWLETSRKSLRAERSSSLERQAFTGRCEPLTADVRRGRIVNGDASDQRSPVRGFIVLRAVQAPSLRFGVRRVVRHRRRPRTRSSGQPMWLSRRRLRSRLTPTPGNGPLQPNATAKPGPR